MKRGLSLGGCLGSWAARFSCGGGGYVMWWQGIVVVPVAVDMVVG